LDDRLVISALKQRQRRPVTAPPRRTAAHQNTLSGGQVRGRGGGDHDAEPVIITVFVCNVADVSF